jgi:hypothetical protein
LVLVTLLTAPAHALQGPCCTGSTDPAVVGQWSGPWDWTWEFGTTGCGYDELSHAALIPTGPQAGKVLLWRRDCLPSGITTTTWVFEPASPGTLIQVSTTLASDIFCGGMSWDASGKLIVAGGFPSAGAAPAQTYRFDPRALPAYASWPPVPFGSPPLPPYFAPGANWKTQLGDMSLARYYPTLIALLKATMGGSQTVCTQGSAFTGGHAALSGPPAITSEGNEVWQVLLHGATAWDCPVIPAGMISSDPHYPSGWTSPERYALHPVVSPPSPLLDSYARAFQLSITAHRQVFVAGDVDTVGGQPPSGNAPGDAWVMKVPYVDDHPDTPQDWQLWRAPVASPPKDRYFGSAAMLFHSTPTAKENRILVFGGSQGAPPNTIVHSSVEEFEPGGDASLGAWHTKTSMLWPRVFLNATLLPTRQVLLEGGDQSQGAHANVPAFCPELFDPGNQPNDFGSTACLAPGNQPSGATCPTPRLYHHVTVLLPDGRVFVAGGNDAQFVTCPGSEFTGEVFSPPYLFQGSRPSIDDLPQGAQHGFGATFGVDVTVQEGMVARVVLLRPSALTHHFDNDQRYIELPFSGGGSGPGTYTMSVVAPPADYGPAGWYMLFVLEQKLSGAHTGKLIPSIARFVKFS